MSVQDTNVEKLDMQEAKKASYGVEAEVAEPTGVRASIPGGTQNTGDASSPTQGSGIKPYTKVGMINSMLGSLSGMKKAEVSAMYDKFKGDSANPMQGSSVNPKQRSIGEEKLPRMTASDIEISDDIKAIFAGTEVSEEFITKATEVYTAAVLAKVNEQIESLESKFDDSLTEEISTVSEGLVERVDSYLDYVVEQWMENNSVAIERGLKAEIVESFMSGLKGLFEEHYIDIPEDKVNVVEELTNKVEELEGSLNEQISRGVDLTKALNEQKKIEAIYTACEGLTQTQVEKLKSLAEGVEFTTEEEFVTKVETLKESYFKADVKVADNSALDEVLVEDEKKQVFSDPSMEIYTKAISQTLAK